MQCSVLRAILAGLLFFAVPQAVHAATTGDSAALAKFDEGKKAYASKDFERALAAFQASLELLPSPNTRLYVARCQRALGRFAGAYTELKRAAHEAQDRLAATGEKRYKATAETATLEAAEVEAKVPHLTVAVAAELPEDFQISLDGQPLDKNMWGTALPIDPGTHQITASGSRRASFEQSVALAPGATARVDVTVPKVPTAVLSLSFASKPAGLAVALDGSAADPLELSKPRELDPGQHRIDADAPGYQRFHWSGDLQDGAKKNVLVKLKAQELRVAVVEARGTPKWLFFGTAGASLACLGVGAIFAAGAQSDSDAEQARPALLRDTGKRDDIRAASTRANVLFVTGGVLGAGAVVLAFTTKWRHSEQPRQGTAWMVSPWAGPGAGGVATAGSF